MGKISLYIAVIILTMSCGSRNENSSTKVSISRNGPPRAPICGGSIPNVLSFKSIPLQEGSSLKITSSIEPGNAVTTQMMMELFGAKLWKGEAARHILQGVLNGSGNFVGGHHLDTLLKLQNAIKSAGVKIQNENVKSLAIQIKGPRGQWLTKNLNDTGLREALSKDPRIRLNFMDGNGKSIHTKFSTVFPTEWTRENINKALYDALSAAPTHIRVNDKGWIDYGVFGRWAKNTNNEGQAFLIKSTPDDVRSFYPAKVVPDDFMELKKLGDNQMSRLKKEWEGYLKEVLGLYSDYTDDKGIIQKGLNAKLKTAKKAFEGKLIGVLKSSPKDDRVIKDLLRKLKEPS